MKKNRIEYNAFLIITFVLIINISFAYSQVPEKLSYLAAIRNSNNELVINKNVGIRLQIKQGSEFGGAVYVETHSLETDKNGFINLEIGGGKNELGSFASIDWTKGPYFLYIEIDPDGGTNYGIFALNQITSVPYALHAKTADSMSGGASMEYVQALKTQIEDLQVLTGLRIKDFDGNIYKTVTIGNQTWMAENLKTTHYADGQPIQEGSKLIDTFDIGDKYWFVPFGDMKYKDIYGLYYSWYAVVRGNNGSDKVPSGIQGVCPTGWHVPSSDEYDILIKTLGGEMVAGGKLKATGTDFWEIPNFGATNESGFSAIGSGDYQSDMRVFDKTICTKVYFIGVTSSFLDYPSAEMPTYNVILLSSSNPYASAYHLQYNLTNSVTVRCVKD